MCTDIGGSTPSSAGAMSAKRERAHELFSGDGIKDTYLPEGPHFKLEPYFSHPTK